MKEKIKTVYVCSECGETYHKWQGQCSTCKAWNTIEEDVVVQQTSSSKRGNVLSAAGKISFQQLDDVLADDNHIRIKTIPGTKQIVTIHPCIDSLLPTRGVMKKEKVKEKSKENDRISKFNARFAKFQNQ